MIRPTKKPSKQDIKQMMDQHIKMRMVESYKKYESKEMKKQRQIMYCKPQDKKDYSI